MGFPVSPGKSSWNAEFPLCQLLPYTETKVSQQIPKVPVAVPGYLWAWHGNHRENEERKRMFIVASGSRSMTIKSVGIWRWWIWALGNFLPASYLILQLSLGWDTLSRERKRHQNAIDHEPRITNHWGSSRFWYLLLEAGFWCCSKSVLLRQDSWTVLSFQPFQTNTLSNWDHESIAK